MPDPEVVPTENRPDGTVPVLTEGIAPTETALTRTEVAELFAKHRKELEEALGGMNHPAYKAAQRSESKAQLAISKIAKVEALQEALATRGMDESEARLWKAERAVERANETTQVVNQQQEYEQAQSAFRQRSTAFLASEGIKPDDERLTASFAKYAGEAKTYADWDNALLRAVADVHKSEAKRVADESKTAVEKAREEERARLRNENKAVGGKVDNGHPATAGKTDWASLSDEEFKANDPYSAEAIARRRRQTR